MVIDLTRLPYGQCDSWSEEQQLRGSYIINELRCLIGNWNQIVISSDIYNAIEKSFQFKLTPINNDQIDSIVKVGHLFNWECFVSLEIEPSTLILQWDVQKKREFKIDSLLGNSYFNTEQLIVNIIDC